MELDDTVVHLKAGDVMVPPARLDLHSASASPPEGASWPSLVEA
jgi:hypothetical protein